MTIEELRKLHLQRPFKPFDLHLADGRSLPVDHPEFMLHVPKGRTIALGVSDGTIEIIDLLLVTSVTLRANGSRKIRRPRR